MITHYLYNIFLYEIRRGSYSKLFVAFTWGEFSFRGGSFLRARFFEMTNINFTCLFSITFLHKICSKDRVLISGAIFLRSAEKSH
jgi:hypothetical protein